MLSASVEESEAAVAAEAVQLVLALEGMAAAAFAMLRAPEVVSASPTRTAIKLSADVVVTETPIKKCAVQVGREK